MPPVAPNPVQAGIGPALHGTPAPYGRACTNCARAKCRCIYRTDGARCDRCHRLDKECSPSVSARRRSNKRQASSRTAQLEEKLEDLVTMLRNQNAIKPASSSQFTHNGAPGIPTPSSNSLSDASPVGNGDGFDKPSPHENPGLRAAAHNNPFPDACEPNPFCDRSSDSAAPPLGSMVPYPNTPDSRLEAEECLRAFRAQYLPTFPCVYIPPSVTAEQLREEGPMLWLSIMVVTCQSPSRQVVLCDTLQRIVAQKVVMEHEKSMDILFGLIVFLGWSQYHRKDKPYISVFAQLTISLIFSLSLHKPPGGDSIMLCFKPYHVSKSATAERTMEERRAVLACFHITSQVSFTLSKMDGLHWTPYMDQCLDELSRNPETPNDEILVTQVRMQLVVEQLNRATWQFYEPQVGLGSAGPPLPFISALHSQREKIKKELPRSIERQDFINLQLIYTKLATLESGLSRKPTPSSNPDFRRYDTCSKCLEATKDWFDIYFLVPISDYPAMAFTFWCQLMHCLISLYKLTVLDEPAWDRGTVRDTIDVIDVCDKIGERFAAVSANRPLTCGSRSGQGPSEEDMFVKSARMAATMKARWGAELAAMEKPAPSGAAAGNAGTSGVAGDFVDNVTTGPMAVPMVITDDMWIPDNTWLTDVFNASWE